MKRHSSKQRPTPDQRKIVTEIKRLYRRDEPLNIAAVKRNHPELIRMAYAIKPFWGWKQALEMAGIDYSDIRVELRDYVTCRICGKELASLGVHLNIIHETGKEEYLLDYPGAELMSEGMRARMMGRSRTGAGGLTKVIMPHWEPIWSAEYILDRAAELHRGGVILNSKTVLAREQCLKSAAQQYLESWDTVLIRIGLNPLDIRMSAPARHYSRKDVIREMRLRKRQGLPLNPAAVEGDNKALKNAIQRRFDHYTDVLNAIGVDPARVMLQASRVRFKEPQMVIREIGNRKQHGLPLNASAVMHGKQADGGLYYSGEKYFGSWGAAVEAAGLCYDKIRHGRKYKDGQAVLKEIRRRKRLGQPLYVRAVMTGADADRSLYNSAKRDFGSWGNAIQNAGFQYETIARRLPTRYPTKISVTVEIRRRRRNGLPLSPTKVREGKQKDGALFHQANKLFGSWRVAVEAAGYSYRNVVPGMPNQFPDAAAVIAGIRRRKREGQALNGGCVRNQKYSLFEAARRHFSDWPAAVEAAGIRYEKVVSQRRRYPSAEKVVAQIRVRNRQGLSLNMSRVQSGEHADVSLYTAARQFCGSWRAAIETAGIDYDSILPKQGTSRAKQQHGSFHPVKI